MMKPWMAVFVAVCTCGCGAASYGYGGMGKTAAYESAPRVDYAAVEEVAGGVAYGREEYRFAADEPEADLASPARGKTAPVKTGKDDPYRPGRAGPSPPETDVEHPVEPDEPLVVYSGYLKLRVKRLLEAVDEIERITAEKAGYIESRTRDVVVVRIPASDFDEVLAGFSRVGELLGRRIKALDVTEQFTDLGARLAVAREARARLLALLERVADVEERLLILREVGRLSELIESYESTLATLRNLVDYFTITIELVPVVDDRAIDSHSSPFPWIRALAAHRVSITDGRNEFSITLPPSFVLFDKDDSYRAQAADTTVIRGGVVDNEPRGDSSFWSDAVDHELRGRGESADGAGVAGALHYRVYRSDDVQPRWYLVAVAASGEDLYVIEVFYPNQQSFAAHHEAVIAALATFEVR